MALGTLQTSMSTTTPNLVTIVQTAEELLRFSFFSKWRPAAILDFVLAPNLRHGTLRTVRRYPRGYGTLRTAHVYQRAKFGDNS